MGRVSTVHGTLRGTFGRSEPTVQKELAMDRRTQQALRCLQDRLTFAEDFFFAWLVRVMAAAVLVGAAWIDDAPPLEIGAMIVALYVGFRVVMQFGNFVSTAPFENQTLKVVFAIGALVLLGLSFVVVAIFVDRLAKSVVG